MKTHRMYRQSRPEQANILVLKPGVNYVPVETLIRQSWFRDVHTGHLVVSGEGILAETDEAALAYYDVPAKYFEALAATPALERQRLMFGTWVIEPSKSYKLNGFDQHGKPVSETVNVPMFQDVDEPAVQSEHSYSVLVGADDPYKAPEQVSNDDHLGAMHHIVTRIPAHTEVTQDGEDTHTEFVPERIIVSAYDALVAKLPGSEATGENWQALYDILPREVSDDSNCQ